MGAVSPARCLLCRGIAATSRRGAGRAVPKSPISPSSTSRPFSMTSQCLDRKKASHPSFSSEALKAITPTSVNRLTPYTPFERAQLAKKYTPAQLAALSAGEEAISSDDLISQGALHADAMSISYLDDFATMRPVVDHPVRNPEENYDPNLREKDDDESAADLADFIQSFPDDTPEEEAHLRWMQWVDNVRMTVGKEEAERAPRSYLSTPLPKMHDPNVIYPSREAGAIDPAEKRVLQYTGFDIKTLRNFTSKQLVCHRVVNQTRMGKKQSMYYLVCVGNGQGLLGIGEGKSEEPEDARKQALMAAYRNMHAVPRYEDRTIYGEVEKKVGATLVKLSSRPPGFGVRTQQYIFEMARCAGITDLAARVTRSRNPMNVCKATFAALRAQRLPDDIARARGKKLVDVRKVYYGGNV